KPLTRSGGGAPRGWGRKEPSSRELGIRAIRPFSGALQPIFSKVHVISVTSAMNAFSRPLPWESTFGAFRGCPEFGAAPPCARNAYGPGSWASWQLEGSQVMAQTLSRTRLRSLLALALGVPLAILGAGAAEASTYATNDLVGIFVNTGTELEVDLGPLSGLKNGESFSFAAPPGFGPGGADGGTFAALQTFAPFTGTFPRNVTFTTDASVDPRSFDNKGTYITKIAQAQGSIDAGNGSGWLPSLNALAPAGEGGIIINTATEISMLASNVA